MITEISHLNPLELIELAKKAEALAAQKHREGMDAIRAELAQIAKERGYSICELFGAPVKPAAKIKGKAAPKYRSPHGATWSGKGRRPDWVNAHLAAGYALESLLIAGGA